VRIDGADTDLLVIGRPPLSGSMAVAESEVGGVMRVNGSATEALAVWQLPVKGPLVLAQAGDGTLRHLGRGVGHRQGGVHLANIETPMVWARREGDGLK